MPSQRWSSLHDLTKFDAWFDRIVVNTCRDRLRQASRRPTTDIAEAQLSSPDMTAGIHRRLIVGEALTRLKPDDVVVDGTTPLPTVWERGTDRKYMPPSDLVSAVPRKGGLVIRELPTGLFGAPPTTDRRSARTVRISAICVLAIGLLTASPVAVIAQDGQAEPVEFTGRFSPSSRFAAVDTDWDAIKGVIFAVPLPPVPTAP